MKKLLLIALILYAGNATASSLPDCPSDQSERYHNCFGTHTYASGSKYVGEFKDNKINGQGTLNYGVNSKWAGDTYVGEWRDSKRNGQGTYTYANGDTYIGEWKDNKKHGQGTKTWADGDKYVGEWKNDKRQGLTWKDELEIFVILFLLIFFGLCLNQFFGINILSVTQSIIFYPFKQLALSIRYFFSLTLVKIFMKTLLILIFLFLIYLIYMNREDIFSFLVIFSPVLLLIGLTQMMSEDSS